MKCRLIGLIMLPFLISLKVSSQVPNNDFENWTFFGWFYNPDDWTTNNNQILATMVMPDSDAYTGNLALKLYNNTSVRPIASTTFATSVNISSLSAYIKLKLIFNDSVSIIVREFYNGNVADSGIWIGVADILNYMPVNVPVSQNNSGIDSAQVDIKGGNQNNLIFEGTSFIIDHLQLVQTSGTFEIPSISHWDLYPVPATDVIYLGNYHNNLPAQISIFNVAGVLSKKIFLGNEIHTMSDIPQSHEKIDISYLPSGTYILELNSANELRRQKFIKW